MANKQVNQLDELLTPLKDDELPIYSSASSTELKKIKRSNFVSEFNVKDYGAIGNGIADDTTALQSALTAAQANGGVVFVPAGTYLCSSALTIYQKTILRGQGKATSILQFTHTGDGINSTWPINSSTAANILIQDIQIYNTNASNTGGGFVDVGGAFIYLEHVKIAGFKYGVIFDQTEVSDITACEFGNQITGGVWLVANDDHTPGATGPYTNRISIKNCQFNSTGTIAIIDDGGYAHTFEDNNYNGWQYHIRVAGTLNCSILGGEFESATAEPIIVTNTSYNTASGVGAPYGLLIDHAFIIAAPGLAAVRFYSCATATLTNNYCDGGGNPAISGTDNIANFYSANNFVPTGAEFTTVASYQFVRSGANNGIGVNPTAALHIRGGSASANSAPLKINSGTLMSTPEGGAIEFDGTNLYFTQNGGARKTISFT